MNTQYMPTKIVLGAEDELTYDEDLILEISASQSTSIRWEEFDSAFCNVKLINDGRITTTLLNELNSKYSNRIPIKVYFHGETEELFGTYLIEECNFEEDNDVINISAFDVLYFLNYSFYDKGSVYIATSGGTSLKDYINKSILPDISEKNNLNVEFDLTLATSGALYGYISYVSHREALRLLSETTGNYLYVNSEGKITFTPYVSDGIELTDDNILENSITYDTTDVCMGIEAKIHNFTYKPNTDELITLAEVTDIALTSEEQTITIEYGTYPAKVDTVTASSNLTIVSQNLYSERATFVVTGSGTGWITLIGYAYVDEISIVKVGEFTKKVKIVNDNYLLKSSSPPLTKGYGFDRYQKIKFNCEYIGLSDSASIPKLTSTCKFSHQVLGSGMKFVTISKVTRTITPDDERVELEFYA